MAGWALAAAIHAAATVAAEPGRERAPVLEDGAERAEEGDLAAPGEEVDRALEELECKDGADCGDGQPSPGNDDQAERGEDRDFACIFVSGPDCGTHAHLELGMGWGESHSYVGWQWSYRGFVEAGLLVDVGSDFRLGPVAELGFDTGRVTSGYTLSSKVKSRYWIGGSIISLDVATGLAFERYTFDDGWESGKRAGPTTDVAVSIGGVAAPYFAVSHLGDPGGSGGSETRLLTGFRASLLGFGALLAPFGAALDAPIF